MPVAAMYFGLVLARIGAFVAAFPLFAPRTPRLVRIGLTLALAVFFVTSSNFQFPTANANTPTDLTDIAYLLALMREAVIGVVVGFAFGLFMLPARVAGEFVSHQVGFAFTPSQGITDHDSSTTIVQLFEIAAGILFLGLDGHHVVLTVLGESFIRAPLGGSLMMPAPGVMVGGLSSAQQMGLLISGPVALSLFLVSIALAMTARAAPQLNIHSIGFTLQVIVVLVGTLFLFPEIVQTMSVALERMGVQVRGMWG